MYCRCNISKTFLAPIVQGKINEWKQCHWYNDIHDYDSRDNSVVQFPTVVPTAPIGRWRVLGVAASEAIALTLSKGS